MRACTPTRLVFLVFSVSLLFASRTHAQSAPGSPPVTRLELKAGDQIRVANQVATGGIDPIRCDSSGNVYMRPASGKTRTLLSPILRISADGQSTMIFDVSEVAEVKEAKAFEIYDFAVRKNGKILALLGIVTKEGDPSAAIVQIDEDDKSTSFVRIDSQFSPRQIAPMPSDMFLLSGIQYSTQIVGTQFRQGGKPFTAVFDAQGKLVKEIQLPDDVKVKDIDSSKAEKPDISAIQAVDLSRFIVSDDGSIYMLRSGAKPKVYVISSGGEVLRSFEVDTPAEDASAPTLFYASGRLAFDFYVPDSRQSARMSLIIRIIDPQNGQILWDYVPGKDIYGIPACYSGRDFTFLSGTPDRRLALLKVSPL